MDKREQIDKVLRTVTPEGFYWSTFIDALAEQAIVIEAETKQYTCCTKKHEHALKCGWDTIISLATQTFFGDRRREIGLRGRHGTPGKALAIIVPLEE